MSSNLLAQLEDSVLQEARQEAIDTSTAGGRERLRTLIASAIAARFGERATDSGGVDIAKLATRAFQNLAGYGPLESLLEDPDVWEICVNAPDAIFVKRHSGVEGYHPEVFHDDEHVARTITRILDSSTTSHRKLDPTEGLQDAQLNDGSRIHIAHRDLGGGGHLIVNIRRFTGMPHHDLAELRNRGMFDQKAHRFLSAAAKAPLTTVIAGAPGSGKTTLLSCLAAELDPSTRVVTAEEVFEINVPLPNVASLQTRPARSDRPAITLRSLVAGFLRMAPEVAIVGEVRDREALPLLLTLSSGIKGFTTMHSGSARQALSRLRFICQLADTSSEIPMGALSSLISEAIDLVVFVERFNGRPQIAEIVAVEDLQAGPESNAFTVTDVFSRAQPEGPLTYTGILPTRIQKAFARAGIDLAHLLNSEVDMWLY